VRDGNLPDPDSVRVEEFINFFDQEYEPPTEAAFAIHVEGAPSRFGGDKHWLMRVGLQGKSISSEDRKDATLIFTIDVSGSMAREDRLGLVKKSLRLLVDELRPPDEVGIVIYGSSGQVLLKPTSGEDKKNIMKAIYRLEPAGSTYVEDGLRVAYKMAVDRVEPGRITRVIVLSDGVGNVGNTGADSILRQVQDQVEQGVTLTTVGFGMGNYNDVLMEQLANDGDGAYYYVDELAEARRIFVENLTGTLQVIAKDAKVQVDFNPEVVSRYRLLGYENRRIDDDRFRDDTVDAGEIGADHSVTALYELKLHDGTAGPLGTVFVRYQEPDFEAVVEINKTLKREELFPHFEDTPVRFQLAAVVAEYAEILRESYWAQGGSLKEVVAEARRVQGLLPREFDVAEFADLTQRTLNVQDRASR
jgi:Ca-activated chloride channel family protein